MTTNLIAGIVASLERTAESRRQLAKDYRDTKARNHAAADTLDSLAEQFNAGDYDAGLMGKYAEAVKDSDRTSDVAKAANLVLDRIGETLDLTTADDVLDSILRELEHA